MSETMIEMKLVIANKLNSKSPWLPETQVVEGHTFVKLDWNGWVVISPAMLVVDLWTFDQRTHSL